MKPLLLFSDLHLKMESMHVCQTVLDRVLQEADRLGTKTVGFLGDWYHLRYAVPVVVQNAVIAWLEAARAQGIEIILLPGNHDQVDEVGRNALEVFTGWPNVKVYSEPTVDEWGAWVPYRKPEFIPEILEQVRAPGRVLFAHLPVRGAMMNNLKEDEHGIPLGKFKGFRQVILGHYHKQQTFLGGMAHYVGSPYQTRADEWGQEKGFALWTGKAFHRLQQDIGPKYHRLSIDQLQEGALVPWGPQDTVRLAVPEVTPELKKWAEQTDGHVILEDQSEHVVQTRFAFKEGTTLQEYVNQYMLDTAPKDKTLDQNVLWAQWQELNS